MSIERKDQSLLTSAATVPKCSGCGCTELSPCADGCGWVVLPEEGKDGFCSACLQKAGPLNEAERRAAIVALSRDVVTLHLRGHEALFLLRCLQSVFATGEETDLVDWAGQVMCNLTGRLSNPSANEGLVISSSTGVLIARLCAEPFMPESLIVKPGEGGIITP